MISFDISLEIEKKCVMLSIDAAAGSRIQKCCSLVRDVDQIDETELAPSRVCYTVGFAAVLGSSGILAL